MRIYAKGMVIEFNGSHTANVYTTGGEVDCFTFAFEKNRASYLDFLAATMQYLEHDEVQ